MWRTRLSEVSARLGERAALVGGVGRAHDLGQLLFGEGQAAQQQRRQVAGFRIGVVRQVL
jgi:hypothetical protein